MKRKLDPNFSNWRRPPASVDRVNTNEYQLICKGNLVQIYRNKMVLEPNVSPHKQIIKDDDVKECISIE